MTKSALIFTLIMFSALLGPPVALATEVSVPNGIHVEEPTDKEAENRHGTEEAPRLCNIFEMVLDLFISPNRCTPKRGAVASPMEWQHDFGHKTTAWQYQFQNTPTIGEHLNLSVGDVVFGAFDAVTMVIYCNADTESKWTGKNPFPNTPVIIASQTNAECGHKPHESADQKVQFGIITEASVPVLDTSRRGNRL